MSFRLDISKFDRKELKEIQKILTFVFHNPFGGDKKIYAFKKVSEKILLVPFQAGLRLSGQDFKHYKGDDEKPWIFTGELYPRQQELHEQMFPIISKRGSVSINAYTAWGKTIQSAKLAESLIGGTAGKVLITFSYISLEDGWLETFKAFTNAKAKIVMEEGDDEGADVLICRVGNLKYIKSKIDVLILDEAHSLCTQIILDKLLEIRTKFLIALTATPERDDGMDDVIVALAGGKKHQFFVSYKKPFQIYPLNTGYSEKDCKSIAKELKQKKKFKGNFEKTRGFLETCLAMHPERNDKIIIMLSKLVLYSNFKIAVIGDRVEEIDYIYEAILDTGLSVARLRGGDKKPNNSRILIGGIKKMGVGFDDKMGVKGFDGKRINLIIYIISTYKLEQSVGRSRADKPYVVHLIDQHRWFEDSFKDNLKWYEEHFTEEAEIHTFNKDPWNEITNALIESSPLS